MYKFITKFLNPKPPVPFTISFDSIPSWVSDRKQKAMDALSAETNTPVKNIRNGMAQLQHIVNNIAGAEHDPAIHPKLKSIAKNSLPLFVKAMNSSLSKELPDEIEEFYTAAVESVKGCINSTRGQGRYLQIVFPEEMKAVKTGVDEIGHEINRLTSSLSNYRKEKNQLDSITGIHDSVVAIHQETIAASARDQRIITRIAEIKNRIESIETELVTIASDKDMKNVDDLQSAMESAGLKRDEVIRRYTSLTMTASHVFRKAEKIAARQHHPEEIAKIRQTMEILSDHDVPDCDDLTLAITAAFPIALRMIESGEIPLKNKEERTIFSDTARFCDELGSVCRDLKQREEELVRSEQALAAHPLLARKRSLDREKIQLETMLQKENHSREELDQWREKNAEKIPSLIEELTRKMKDIIGETVQIQDIDWSLAGG